jgi:hypothetical protein
VKSEESTDPRQHAMQIHHFLPLPNEMHWCMRVAKQSDIDSKIHRCSIMAERARGRPEKMLKSVINRIANDSRIILGIYPWYRKMAVLGNYFFVRQ